MTADLDTISWPARPSGAPRFDMPPKLTISITETCPLACAHCYADCNRADAKPELSFAEWISFIDHLVENGVIQMYIEGGEPFHRPDFHDLLAYAAQRAMTLVRTHGTTIDTAAARRLRRDKVGRIFVDVMGADAATHDAHTGTPGSFARSCDAVRALVDAGVTTDMLVILTRQTAPQLQGILELAGELGALRLGVLRLYPLGRAKARWAEMALSLDEQMAAIRALRPPPGVGVMQSWHPNDRNCCWQAAAVTAHGRSIGCMYLREYVDFGDVREVDFFDSWREDKLYASLRGGAVDKACPSCAATSNTGGGCRSAAYAFTGSWTAPDPFCPTTNDGVDLRVLPQRLLSPGA
jgi:radical SAM protein with 4Fe4S-binding SPASM domain